jgi:hypothetical protein
MTYDIEQLEAEAKRVAERIRERGGWVSEDYRICPKDAAELLHRALGTLTNWRGEGRGPRPIFTGRNVTYFIVDVLAAQRLEGTSWKEFISRKVT